MLPNSLAALRILFSSSASLISWAEHVHLPTKLLDANKQWPPTHSRALKIKHITNKPNIHNKSRTQKHKQAQQTNNTHKNPTNTNSSSKAPSTGTVPPRRGRSMAPFGALARASCLRISRAEGAIWVTWRDPKWDPNWRKVWLAGAQ